MEHKEEIKLALLRIILICKSPSVRLKLLPMVTLLTLAGVDGVYLAIDLLAINRAWYKSNSHIEVLCSSFNSLPCL